MKLRIALSILLSALASLAVAGGASTSAIALRLPRGARPVALGGAYLALADDALALLYNPAGLTELRDPQLTGTHMEWLDGVRDDAVQLGVPLYGFGAWGLGATYLYTTDQGRDNWGVPTQGFNDFDFSAQAAFSLLLSDNGSIGLTYKILREGYESHLNMGSSFDLGARYCLLDRRLVLALGVTNVGSFLAVGANYSQQAITLKGGLAYTATRDLKLALEYDHQPIDFFNTLRAGAEYSIPFGAEDGHFTLRGGYALGADSSSGGLSGLSTGLGAHFHGFDVDYAFIPKGDLGNSQLLSLSMAFSQR